MRFLLVAAVAVLSIAVIWMVGRRRPPLPPDDPARTRYVTILSLGRFRPLTEAAPLMSRVDGIGFPVEMWATLKPLEMSRVRRWLNHVLQKIQSQWDHYVNDHGQHPPLAMQSQRDLALRLEAALDSGDPTETRFDVHVRMAIPGSTEEQATERAERVCDHFEPGVTVVRPSDQYRSARAFIPGEPAGSSAYRRRVNAKLAAQITMPATASVGHAFGIPLGFTQNGGRRLVSWNLHRSMEVRERSGLTTVCGSLGSGKSNLLGHVAWWAGMSGVPVRILDPGSRLEPLCDAPEWAGMALPLNLLTAKPGTCNPYRVIPDPRRDDYPSDVEYREACEATEGQRRGLCEMILQQLLPPILLEDVDVVIALNAAVEQSPADSLGSPRLVIDQLRRIADSEPDPVAARRARATAQMLDSISRKPAARLIFPSYDRPSALDSWGAWRLIIIGLRGLTLPDERKPRKEWTDEERVGMCLLSLAAYLTRRAMYEGGRHQRKLIIVDEQHAIGRVATGVQFLNEFARDTRAWDTRGIVTSQNPGDFTALDIDNLLDSAFVMRSEGATAQEQSLELLRVERGVGYEKILGQLSEHTRGDVTRSGYREAVWSDGEGGIERIVIERAFLPAHVQKELDTTAAPSRSALVAV